MGIWDSVTAYVDEKEQAVSEWWNDTEDIEAAPKSYQQQAQSEKLAEGSALPKVETASNATGETVVVTASPLVGYQPWLIGGGVLVVVLAVFAMMMKGGK